MSFLLFQRKLKQLTGGKKHNPAGVFLLYKRSKHGGDQNLFKEPKQLQLNIKNCQQRTQM